MLRRCFDAIRIYGIGYLCIINVNILQRVTYGAVLMFRRYPYICYWLVLRSKLCLPPIFSDRLMSSGTTGVHY